MAKSFSMKKPAEKPGKGVAVQTKAGLPSTLMKRMEADAGKGVSKAQEDNLIPIITITQDLTPQAKKKDDKYIEGCEPGMIWLKNEPTTPFIPGEDGILVQSCFFDKDFVEWIPRTSGGGLVARHREMPEDAKQMQDPTNPNKKKWVRKNGNEMVETRYHVCRVHMEDGRKLGFVIPFQSTGHTVSRGWMTTINNSLLQNGETAPSWCKFYRLKLRSRKNVAGTWFIFEVHDEGWIETEEDYEAGLALYTAFAKGEKEMDTSTLAEHGRETDDGKM